MLPPPQPIGGARGTGGSGRDAKRSGGEAMPAPARRSRMSLLPPPPPPTSTSTRLTSLPEDTPAAEVAG
jgi:hypothetical protein